MASNTRVPFVRIAAGTLALLLGLPLIVPVPAHAAPTHNLTPTPPMGWNSWNWHGKKDINEQIVIETIDAMAALGLRDAGYDTVVVDGGWRDTKLGPGGELLPHPVKFPGGMKRLADYAHAKGMKFGVHTVPGTHDCGGDAVGAYGREEVHIRQFVDWGLDFVKVDKCKLEGDWTEPQVEAVYRKWSRLLAACGRPIVFSISAYTFRDWNPDVCHMSRTTGDILARIHKERATFDDGKPYHRGILGMMTIVEENNIHAARAGNGYWNDPDMLVTGDQGLTPDEERTHFALWCIMTSPLFLGSDPRTMTPEERDIVLNRDAIAIDQDPTEQGRRVQKDGAREVWAKRLKGGRVAVLLLNRDAKVPATITVKPADLGLGASCGVRDVWAKKDLGVTKGALKREVAPHAGAFLLLDPWAK